MNWSISKQIAMHLSTILHLGHEDLKRKYANVSAHRGFVTLPAGFVTQPAGFIHTQGEREYKARGSFWKKKVSPYSPTFTVYTFGWIDTKINIHVQYMIYQGQDHQITGQGQICLSVINKCFGL